MILTEVLLANAVRVCVLMTAAFCIACIRRRNDIADVVWGLGFAMIAWTTLASLPIIHGRALLLAILVTVWGVRLALHIYIRNRMKSEDFRYAQWRKDWGKWFYPRSFVQVFLLQGFFMLIVSLPVIIGMVTPGGSGVQSMLSVGLSVWVIGFLFESIGDFQLSQFIRNPHNQGKIMTSGLWSWTRHPNYFGEVSQWWGIFLITLSVPTYWFLAVLGPLMITWLILYVSGIPMLERKYEGNPDFEVYKKRTSAFFPLPPRHERF